MRTGSGGEEPVRRHLKKLDKLKPHVNRRHKKDLEDVIEKVLGKGYRSTTDYNSALGGDGPLTSQEGLLGPSMLGGLERVAKVLDREKSGLEWLNRLTAFCREKGVVTMENLSEHLSPSSTTIVITLGSTSQHHRQVVTEGRIPTYRPISEAGITCHLT